MSVINKPGRGHGRGLGARHRRRLVPEDRRRQIKEAAIEVFASKGYQSTAVGDIVARAGAAQGTFYLYFPNKKALFLELMDDFGRRIQTSFDPLAVDRAALPMADADAVASLLTEGYRSYFRLCRENLPLIRVFFQETVAVDEGFRRKRQSIYEKLADQARSYLDRGVEMGLLRPMITQVVAHCIVGMVERVTAQWLLASKDPKIESLAEELARFETFGIASRASTGTREARGTKRKGD